MEHDIIVILSNRNIDTDYTPRRLRKLIQKALRELKAKRAVEARGLSIFPEDEEGIK